MTQIVGTPNTDEVLAAIVEGIKGYKAASSDGKLDWTDFGYLMPVMAKLGPAVEDIKEVIPELKDLDSAEGAALIAKLASLSGEAGDKVKAVLEGLIQVVSGGLKIYGAFKPAPVQV
jgi:dihydroorotate dehydrogenase